MSAFTGSPRALLLLIFLLMGAQRQRVKAKSNFEMIYSNISCSSLDTKGRLAQLSCYVSKNVKRRSFSMEIKFNQDVPQFFTNLLVVLPRKSSDFVLLNLTNINGCQLLSNRNQVPFVELGRAMLERFGNLPHRCPFRKDVFYYIRGFRLDIGTMPAFTFETDMKVWFDFLVERATLYKGYIESRIQMRHSG